MSLSKPVPTPDQVGGRHFPGHALILVVSPAPSVLHTRRIHDHWGMAVQGAMHGVWNSSRTGIGGCHLGASCPQPISRVLHVKIRVILMENKSKVEAKLHKCF